VIGLTGLAVAAHPSHLGFMAPLDRYLVAEIHRGQTKLAAETQFQTRLMALAVALG